MPKILNEEIVKMEGLSKLIYKMTVYSPYIAENAVPGQFVNIKCSEGINALLRRPISICDVDRKAKTVDIIFQVKGIGTEYLAKKQAGDKVDMIAPLGNGFDIGDKYKNIVVVGGGIGIFPLLNLLKEKPDAKSAAFLGFRNKDFVVMEEEFEKASDYLELTTDDGSYGSKGLVVDGLKKYLEANTPDVIYTCGPTPMIKSVAQIAKDFNIACQVSLEQRMGCGIGAYLVCACKTKLGDEWEYSHVCSDGPVFWSDEVIFE